MNVQEAADKFGKVAKQLETNYNGALMVYLGNDALAAIKQRIQETGVDAKGKNYPAYSTKDTLVGCKTFVRKSSCQTLLGSKEKRKALDWRTVNGHRLAILPGGYKKIRELEGRQTNHVDFIVTGRMWSDISVISNNSDHMKGTVIIGAKKDEEKKKLSGNTSRKGEILDLSIKEQDELKRRFNLEAINIFKENGL